jgi:hypothetical protein
VQGFVEQMPQLSLHAATKGPGAILTLSVLESVVGNSPIAVALAVQTIAALLPLLTWAAARRWLDETPARLAGLLVLLTPSFQLFSFVSMDGVFAVVLFATAALGIIALQSDRNRLALSLLTGSMVYVCALFTFSAAFLLPFCGAAAGWMVLRDKTSWRDAAATAVWAACAFSAIYLLMRELAGFDLLHCFLQARFSNSIAMGSAWRSGGHYLFSGLGSFGAFAIGCGIPCVAMWLRGVKNSLHGRSVVDALASSTATTLIVLVLLGLYQWEVERIWLFLVPLVCIVAAHELHPVGVRRPGRMTALLALLWGQTVVSELLLNTNW